MIWTVLCNDRIILNKANVYPNQIQRNPLRTNVYEVITIENWLHNLFLCTCLNTFDLSTFSKAVLKKQLVL
jgi:hypothetical protein